MRTVGGKGASHAKPSRNLSVLQARVSEAEDTLRAIRRGGVDALVVAGNKGPRVFTLEGAEHAYRVLIESMNEGALTVTVEGVILYANGRFAKMVKRPLTQIMSHSFHRLLSPLDRAKMQGVLKRGPRSGSRLQVKLRAADGADVPAQISVRPLPKKTSLGTFAMVVTDMTGPRRSQEMLRALSHRLTQAQESERERIAHELTDNITQALVVILFRLQALVDKLPDEEWPSRGEGVKLSELLRETAEEVERISRNLRPSILKNLGLVSALRDVNEGFQKRTGVPIKFSYARLDPHPPLDAKLALYRIFEEALGNVEKHARARHVTVSLTQRGTLAQLVVHDDGVGFDPARLHTNGNGAHGFGLHRMRERAEFLGGVCTVKSSRGTGTEVKVRIPLSAPSETE